MAKIRFNVKAVPGKKMQIRAVFQDGSKQMFRNIGETIPANKVKEEYKYWDSKNQSVKGLESTLRINAIIEKWKTGFATYRDDCKRHTKKIDIALFIASMAGVTFLDHGSDVQLIPTLTVPFLAGIKTTHDPQTVNTYTVAIRNLTEYQVKRNKVITLSTIDKAFYKDFSDYLISEENNFNRAINKKQKQIISIINYAQEFLKIKVPGIEYTHRHILKTAPAPKFPLSAEELATLRAAALENTYHQMILDSFLLACETGLRYSDIQQLRAAHIKQHVTGTGIITLIDLTNIKGNDNNNMPLSNTALAIVDKYRKEEGSLFEFHYSQAASRTLKLIFEKLELTRPCEVVQMQGARTFREIKPLHEVISFHMGRNTYITRLLSSGLPPAYVQGNAGHSDIAITMNYFRGDDLIRWEETLKVLNKKTG